MLFKKEVLCRFRRIVYVDIEKDYNKVLVDLEEWEIWLRLELKVVRIWFYNIWIREYKVCNK